MKFESDLALILLMAGSVVILIGIGTGVYFLIKLYLLLREQKKDGQREFPKGPWGDPNNPEPLALIACLSCGKWPLWVSLDDAISKAICPSCGKLIMGEPEKNCKYCKGTNCVKIIEDPHFPDIQKEKLYCSKCQRTWPLPKKKRGGCRPG